MKTVTIAELHENLDEYLELVRGGEAVEITDETGPIAARTGCKERPNGPGCRVAHRSGETPPQRQREVAG
jgi:antitoxin (DNA-binding transcriptional repressor) of toxin-antitoxin stability system